MFNDLLCIGIRFMNSDTASSLLSPVMPSLKELSCLRELRLTSLILSSYYSFVEIAIQYFRNLQSFLGLVQYGVSPGLANVLPVVTLLSRFGDGNNH